jgi:hypothetical protein
VCSGGCFFSVTDPRDRLQIVMSVISGFERILCNRTGSGTLGRISGVIIGVLWLISVF